MSSGTADLPRLSDGRLARYSPVGCYPLFYVESNDVLCADCANEDEERDQAPFLGTVEVNWENPDLFCDECGKRIESAYAEDDAQ